MPNWSRPNPSRLNDTSALVRKGTHQYTYKARGSHMTNSLEDMCAAEFAIKGGPDLGMSGQHGAGVVIKTPHEHTRNGSPSPDKNRTVPGNGGSLAAAIACVNKGC